VNVAASYDTIAAAYAEQFGTELVDNPLERALLRAFLERVPGGPVVEVGSGPGNVSAYLRDLGADVSGVDLSPRMVEIARAAHPTLSFEVGSMTGLDRPDGSLGGLVGFYSIIHFPAAELPGLFAEFHRALRPGGQLLLAFLTGPFPAEAYAATEAFRAEAGSPEAGEEKVTRIEAFGHQISLDYYLRPVSLVADLLRDNGFQVHARVDRETEPGERIPRGYLLATKP
jgi:SAM-dependent methyltransferase